MNVFISTGLWRESDGLEVKVSISRPVAYGENPDWLVKVSSSPVVSELDQEIHGASEFQCVQLAVSFIRRIVENSPDLTVHPSYGSLNTELPETLPYSLGDQFYAEVSAKVAEMLATKHADLTKLRLSKFPE